MRKVLKVFLIFLFIIFSLGVNNTEASINVSKNTAIYKAPYKNTIIFNNDNFEKSFIVSSNNFNAQLYAIKTDSDNNKFVHETISPTNNYYSNKIQSYINKNYKYGYYYLFSNIENEIFTRAP